MVNEIVMYQSMFLLGVIMFGFFATSFNNYSDFAEEITLDNNLDRVLQEVGEEILRMIDKGAELKGQSGTFTINIQITLDAEYAKDSYTILVDSGGNLTAQVKNQNVTSFPLGVENTGIEFSGSLVSSSLDTSITYVYDSTSSPRETITLTS